MGTTWLPLATIVSLNPYAYTKLINFILRTPCKVTIRNELRNFAGQSMNS